MNRPGIYRNIVLLMFLVYTAVQVYSINKLSVNYDEGSFLHYGFTLLKGQQQKDILLFESKLPITALNVLPRAVEQILHPGLEKNAEESVRDIINGRYVSLFVSILLGLLILKWSTELYGGKTSLFTLLLYLLCPNFLAHGIFVSSDIFACFFLTLSFYFLWKFHSKQELRFFVLMSVATGLAQISKFSMFHLFLIIPILSLIIYFCKKKTTETTKKYSWLKTVGYAGLFLFINWLIISAAHLFYQPFLPIKDYTFMSGPFKEFQHFISSFASSLPVPLPSSYVSSMDAVMYFDQIGGGVKGSLNGEPYILGQTSVNGFWYYYFVVLFFKLPVTILLLWIGTMLLFLRKFNKQSLFTNEIFILLPAVYYLCYMNFFYSTQLGIRHIMIIFPLLYIFSGKLITALLSSNKRFILYGLLAIKLFLYSVIFLIFFLTQMNLSAIKN